MKLVWCLLLMCCSMQVIAQEDDNTYPDYRKKTEGYTRMAEKDLKGEVASFALAALEDRLNKSPLPAIPPVDYGANFITFEGNGIAVTIRSGPFDASKHKMGLYGEKKHVVRIDGKPFYGSYGATPQYSIASVVMTIGKDTVQIPKEAYGDLYSPVFTYNDEKGTTRTYNGVYLSPDKRTIYVYMLNKELIGSYEVTWIIQDKKYLRRVVDSGILK
ncbi:hypothetical protein HHL16_24545 [Pseudoflavitalea sp. G-6-1-2]|uniref:hypothetical protein n=1 Tax=Pseudoflavitalea sp. G-6-1-2 TaxID=2728841 RepID=UPI00146D16A2|nr:hypothetical protein [Pseudoflavitalea sp. G-6-1-2]NML24070.1 hypothetical protein [Pseudoflavitalea sp. G-6-1-2]